MKKMMVLLVLLFTSLTIAQNNRNLNYFGITDSFGPRMSTQTLHVGSFPGEATLLLVGERSRVGRPHFKYFIKSIELESVNGEIETVVLNRWFHKNTRLSVRLSSPIRKVKIQALHNDLSRSSPSHRLSLYLIESQY